MSNSSESDSPIVYLPIVYSDDEDRQPINREDIIDPDLPIVYSDDEEKQPIDTEDIIDSDLPIVYSDGEEKQPIETEDIIDPDNELYDSFKGVNKLPTGKIIIERYLAAGSFGQIYCGSWENRLVALKKIDVMETGKKLFIYKEDVEEGIKWEVSRLSTTTHPNLVLFYGIYQEKREDYTYLVMEYCEGGNLQKALEREIVPWSKR